MIIYKYIIITCTYNGNLDTAYEIQKRYCNLLIKLSITVLVK